MPKIPRDISAEHLISILPMFGYEIKSQTGSHNREYTFPFSFYNIFTQNFYTTVAAAAGNKSKKYIIQG